MEGRLVLPRKSQAVVKGHKGVSQDGRSLALGLVNSGLGVWGDMDQLVADNPELEDLREEVAESLTMSRANKTLDTYRTPVDEWQDFAAKFKCRQFPVDEAAFLMFLQNGINYDKSKGNKEGGLLNRVYGADLVCNMLGVEGPGSLGSVKSMMESARRQLSRPTQKKLPCDKPLFIS